MSTGDTTAARPQVGGDGPPEPWRAGEGHPRQGLILGIMCLCLVMVVAAVSSLNVAIPTIVRQLDPTSTEQLWIIDAYALVFAGLLLLCGALGDRFGRKYALVAGLVIFALAAMVAAYANNPVQLIAFRAVMGIGAALIMPATLSTLTVVYAPKDRAKAIATWAGFAGAGGAIGPLASGLLLERFWWGSIFFVVVPIAVLALIAIVAVVPNSADVAKHRLDFAGAVLSVLALCGIVFGIIEGPEIGWTSPATLGAFAIGVVAAVVYVLWEQRVAHPLLDPRFFLIPRFGLGALTVTMSFLAMFGMFYLFTLYLQFVLGYSPLEASVRLLPFSAIMIAVAPRSPKLTARFGAANVVALGFLIQSVGFLVATTLDVDASYPLILAAVAPMALGMALIMPPTTNAIVTSLPQDKAGVASAVNDTTREVGGAVGIALLGTLATVGYHSRMDDKVGGLPPAVAEVAHDSIGGAILSAGQLGPAGAQLIADARAAFVGAVGLSFGVAAAVGLVMAAVIARFYPRGVTPVPAGPPPGPVATDTVN
jgi:EmrB/QacA subfamily drug resistance transporter